MSIATRTGDDGNTRLFGGQRVPKDHPRVAAYGAVDELNACVGLVRGAELDPDLEKVLARIQSELFDLGAELATPREDNPLAERVLPFPPTALEAMDRDLQALEDQMPPMTAFVLPGGHPTAAQLHVCRTVARRAERLVVTLARQERVPGMILKYLNRFSDLLFVMARHVNAAHGVPEPEWHSRELREQEDE
jgi:cob(I)alamin adenosyltransferase